MLEKVNDIISSLPRAKKISSDDDTDDKQNAETEFGVKVEMSDVNGFLRIEHPRLDAFNESITLQKSFKNYCQVMGIIQNVFWQIPFFEQVKISSIAKNTISISTTRNFEDRSSIWNG